MANDNQTPRNSAAETEPQPAMLSPDEVVHELRALRARIPIPESAQVPIALRRRLAHVNADFITASVNAAGVSDTVQSALRRSDEDLRLEIDAAGRWVAAIDEMRALLQSMTTANVVRKQRIGLAALQTYQICQQLARDDANQPRLAVHIAEMKRLNKFGRRRKPATEPVPAPQPEPVPQTKTQ
ncbi:MAG: hypothetical protein DMF56_03020 [Acidobacteria bacterium]|nr:MAG: hypothetical protein DMF56_03020 [Acidobacteriota bacterium]